VFCRHLGVIILVLYLEKPKNIYMLIHVVVNFVFSYRLCIDETQSDMYLFCESVKKIVTVTFYVLLIRM